ncbi:MAG: hypothetical protein HOI59_14205 [Nitrospina sp.]|nr:hypothetical protein [Nitrospina sp.]MBT3855384.1 hypothetical protein [Nitrospina sp.]MBT4106070.1 hypothetical protein [Nitrospina sp.]MBT4388460.1 hypothetical protein [Nitrospina sp.]MBT4620937.1 hypothetical protein [Nitrospina sp.]
MKNKWILKLLNLSLFVFGAAYIVLHVEFNEGSYFYYFFKAKVYYSIFNKIIFPVGFWGCFALFYFFYYLLSQRSESHRGTLLHSLRYALFYHLFLLLLTHSNEIVSSYYFSTPFFSVYERLFLAIAFVGYYLAGMKVIQKVVTSGCKFWELVLPVSTIVPFIYSPSPLIHAFYLTLSLGLFMGWQFLTQEKWKDLLGNLISNDYFKIGIIFLLSLGLRLWYAYPYATHDLIGNSADGPVYFKSALAFANGNWGDVNFWHAPFYPLYLSVFLISFGKTSAVLFYSQAILGSVTPVIIFLICQKLMLRRASFIAGLLVALSHLSIHYSVVINRAAPLSIAIPLLMYSILCLGNKFGPLKYLLLGVLFGGTFYLGQETLPVLALFAIYLAHHLWKSEAPRKKRIFHTALIGLGVISIFFSLNGIYHSHTDQWLPLGRASDATHASSLWNYNNNSYAKEMIDMGFDPIQSPDKSSDVFLENPLRISGLLLGKLFTELPDLLFEPGGVLFVPLHLAFESFYSAHLQFYIYLFVLIGLVVFISTKSVIKTDKLLLLGPIFILIIFCSFLVGTFRFRAPFTPLNMIFLATALELFLFRGKSLKDSPWQFVHFKMSLPWKNVLQRKPVFLSTSGIIVAFSIWAIVGNLFPPSPGTPAQYRLTPWLIPSKQKVFATRYLGLNETTYSYYTRAEGNETRSAMEVRFNMCQRLMPGMKPYYQLAVDGKLIGKSKKVLSGCFRVKERIKFNFETGMISLFIFVSPDGIIGELKPISFSVDGAYNKKEKVTMPVASPIPLDSNMKQYIEQFKVYAEKIRIDKPELFLLPE